MEKRRAHYDLGQMKAAVMYRGIDCFTSTALLGLFSMGLSEADGVSIVLGLRRDMLFKSMTTHADSRVWQDVYHAPCPNGKTAYVKVTLQDGAVASSSRSCEMRNPAYCLQCDDGSLLQHGAQDMMITIDGMSQTVPAVVGWHCPTCGTCEFDDGEGKRFSATLAALRQLANAQRAASLRAIRKKLGLRQADAGRLFGGGASAFSEYERGKTQPHKSTVLLLKLLDRHPELLEELRGT